MFQFTHPGRGATPPTISCLLSLRFQFTHPGRGATDVALVPSKVRRLFQFTHPGRGATAVVTTSEISI